MSDHGIVIKNAEVLDSLLGWQYHSKLRALVKWIAENFGIVVTEGYRIKRHPKDLHGIVPVRAMDSRSRIYKTDGQTEQKVADAINEAWKYDPSRPDMKCCVFHAVCPHCGTRHNPPHRTKCDGCGKDITGNWHFHLQTHPKTIFKGKE